jgi:hypothetical protein
MRIATLVVVLGLAAVNVAVAQTRTANTSEPTFAITISTRASTVKQDNPIVITIVITNITKYDIQLAASKSSDEAEFDSVIDVWDSSGAPPAKTKFGKFIAGESDDHISVPALSNVGYVLHPGEQLIETAQVDKIYQMTTPGTYSIRVERGWSLRPQLFVRSNTVTVTVTK